MPLESDPATEPKLVLVTGSGRSGTSTVAGSLKMLGCYVPQPEVKADSSNPRGFFEPRWAVDFHKEVLKAAGVRTLDARPEALGAMVEVTSREELRTRLRDWFATQLQGPQIVVKDPRIFWLSDLWVRTATDLDVSPAVLVMLRHPAEVIGSRDMHYHKKADADRRLARETANLAGWVNVALTNERVWRGYDRAFVRYADLIGDWRSTMATVAQRLGLSYTFDVSSSQHHEVDDFIDVNLRRAQLTWDDIDVPDDLRDVAETVWQALDALADDPEDADAMATMDTMRTRYDELHRHAKAMTQDHTHAAVQAARMRVRRRMAKKLQTSATPSSPSLTRRVMRNVRAIRGGR